MRQVAIICSLLGSFIIYASTIHLFESVLMFLLFGILPGHTEPISARAMLIAYTAAAVTTIGFVVRAHTPLLLSALVASVLKSFRRLSLRRAQA